jgi:hypothetical protein
MTRAVWADAQGLLAREPDVRTLNLLLRQLAKWRSMVLANTQAAKIGSVVQGGPFAGMAFQVGVSEGARATRLLGAYEASLHPVIESAIATGYPQVVDIGCAEGYYAVGMARRLPGARVLAHDTDPEAQSRCRALAQANAVDDRVAVSGLFQPQDFALCARARTLIICDIEGGEDDLLDPAAAPDLAAADLLVEVHDGLRPGLWDRLASRFAATHRITRIDRRLAVDLLPPWAEALSDLDRLLLLWEWRSTPTPWAWMEARG